MELLLPLVIVGGLLLLVISSYNGLVNARNRVDEALGQIQVQLKRRYDLIPNLVEAVKGQMGFEKGVLESV
ncbi:MAG: LemA family protein, partial [Candidatus Limnocylindrus sp.]